MYKAIAIVLMHKIAYEAMQTVLIIKLIYVQIHGKMTKWVRTFISMQQVLIQSEYVEHHGKHPDYLANLCEHP